MPKNCVLGHPFLGPLRRFYIKNPQDHPVPTTFLSTFFQEKLFFCARAHFFFRVSERETKKKSSYPKCMHDPQTTPKPPKILPYHSHTRPYPPIPLPYRPILSHTLPNPPTLSHTVPYRPILSHTPPNPPIPSHTRMSVTSTSLFYLFKK